jgi:AraC-like DNA-binding protein
VTYREYRTATPAAVLWRSTVEKTAPTAAPTTSPAAAPTPRPKLILPDGCLDLIWDGGRLFVAGPDTTARRHQGRPGASSSALRFRSGIGPALLGVPADELLDQMIYFEDVVGSAPARRLAEQVAVDPVGALTGWLAARLARVANAENAAGGAADRLADPLGPRVFALAGAGLSVEAMADRVGLSARQLNRRCQPLFGYGPRHLARVLRLLRAADQARVGRPLAQVAAGCGYYDQAHLSREVRALAGTTPTGLRAELGSN